MPRLLLALLLLLPLTRAQDDSFAQSLSASRRILHAWLAEADPVTLLLPDHNKRSQRIYTPHNSGADLYPYLILTARITDPEIYRGRMMEMLRNEIRYTTIDGLPGEYDLVAHKPLKMSLFGAGEYAKDGLIAVTEALGRTPWFDRMAGMTATAMERAAVPSAFGPLPAFDSELNGDYLQTLVRLYPMTADPRYLAWARRIADAYFDEVLPINHGLPAMDWDFTKHAAKRAELRLRDHGNEMIVGLTLQHALETEIGGERARRWQPALERMLDRVLASANPDGLLYNTVDAATLKPLDEKLSDNWGYVYGAVYTYYQVTGKTKYRDAVCRVLANLPNYRNWNWEPSSNARDPKLGSFDGYADSIESAIYLVNREPVPQALRWIDSEMKVMLAMVRPDGHIEDWYGEGNFNRTALLYALMKSQGARPAPWREGLNLSARREGPALRLTLNQPAVIEFDYARHRRVLNLRKNYVRLNEFPEWFTVDENTLYHLRPTAGGDTIIRLGAELIQGVPLAAGEWIIAPYEKESK